jgi:hypothetical protein
VCDAGPIIHLDELACLHLMTDFSSVLVPNGVCEEVQEQASGSDQAKSFFRQSLCQKDTVYMA